MSKTQKEQKKYSFKNDYSEGAHPNIIEKLAATNLEQQVGYGADDYCKQASDILQDKIQNQTSDIHFVSGGTQANLIVIASILAPYQSVIAAESGHINTHETGAIEATGHKINTVNTEDGKLRPNDIEEVLAEHTDEHMVKPKLVFISNSTELGTVYSKDELANLYSVCQANNLFLYLDGARLGSALCSTEGDFTLAELTQLVDLFYIGGTKNGALVGEAIVINNQKLQDNFRFHLKQRGALLAKGRLLGIQFIELFKDDLYFDLAQHANLMADKLRRKIKDLGYDFLTETTSNQLFPIFPKKLIEEISSKYDFHIWSEVEEEHAAVRLVTSWATKEKMVNEFISDLQKMS